MLTTKTLPFMPGRRALRHYRTELQARLAAEPAARLLPRLLSLPLGSEPLPDPAAILALGPSLTIHGPPAGGRSLALIQTAARWAETGGVGPVLYLPLAEIDLPNLSPRAVVAGAVHRAGLRPELVEGQRPGILLIDDWELLTADRRALWQHFVVAGVAHWTALRAMIALPPGGPWPGLRPITIAPPDDERLAAWLTHLLPDQSVEPILAALRHEPLADLRERLADLVLLALTYPIGGIPTSRAQLYERAFALARPVLDLAADSIPPPTPGLSGVPALCDQPSAVLLGRALLRHYRLARALAGGDDLVTLASLPATERAAVAPLAAGLLDDPTPVLEALWSAGDDEASLRALTICAREAPARAPLIGLRLAEHLAGSAQPEAQALLPKLAPALPALLSAAGHLDVSRTLAALRSTATALPNAPALWLQLCDDLAAPAALRWAAADLVAAAPPAAATLAEMPAGASPTAMAPRAFIAALAGPTSRAALASEPLRSALVALFEQLDAAERRAIVANILIEDLALPEELRALALGSASGDMVEQAAVGPSPALRRAALTALASGEPTAALSALARALTRPDAGSEARREALDEIAAVPHQGAADILIRAALDARLALPVRLRAVDLLAGMSTAGVHTLRRLLATAGLPVVLRAGAVGHLGRLAAGEALPALAAILASPGEPVLRRSAATALGALGQRPELRERAASALVAGLRYSAVDTALGERIARALGNTGAPIALPALAGLLAPGLAEPLRAAWLRIAPDLGRTPAFAWPTLDLPTPARLALLDALADGGTLADPPSRLAELAARQATCLAIAATEGLATLGRSLELRRGTLIALRRCISGEERTDVVRAALAALAQVGQPASELGAILDDPGASPNLRWLAVEALGKSPEALEILRRRFDHAADEPFVQAKAIETLGARGYAPALGVLRRIARGASVDPHLRRTAITALGQIDAPEAATALAALAADHEAPAELRAAAAAALPAKLGPDEQVTLRQALRGERLPADLVAALARALARAGEIEALPSLVRSAQGDRGAEAVASIEAIASLGDPSAAPLLVRLSQSPLVAPGVRLAAVAALLRLDGDEHLPLLREYLVAPSPPLRIQAHAALAAVCPNDPRLGAPLAEPGAPLALRLQALRHLAIHDPDSPIIAAAVAAPDEQPQMRLAAAAVLASSRKPGAITSLAAALDPPEPEIEPAPPLLRRRSALTIGAIARGSGPTAGAAQDLLAAIAAAPDQPSEHRHWASEALLGC
ncbi:MAG: hypothetical protein HGA45_02025 [Chloroflexales bacterium]|nr:hypothetical protein [Chloroflexales bacterium]